MAVESDDDRAALLADFGVAATWSHNGTTASLTGIFDEPVSEVASRSGIDVMARSASFLCAAADLPAGAGQGDSLDVSRRSWSVRAFLPDGNGLVKSLLEAV